MDPRSDQWLRSRAGKLAKLSRADLRQLVRNLNAKFKNKDASIFSDGELFAKYDQSLDAFLTHPIEARRKPQVRGKKKGKEHV
jgi:hypothetical protein